MYSVKYSRFSLLHRLCLTPCMVIKEFAAHLHPFINRAICKAGNVSAKTTMADGNFGIAKPLIQSSPLLFSERCPWVLNLAQCPVKDIEAAIAWSHCFIIDRSWSVSWLFPAFYLINKAQLSLRLKKGSKLTGESNYFFAEVNLTQIHQRQVYWPALKVGEIPNGKLKENHQANNFQICFS